MNFVRDEKRLHSILLFLFAAAPLVSIIGIIEHYWANVVLLVAKVYCPAGFGKQTAFEKARSFATFGNPLYLAAYLSLIFPLAATIFLRGNCPPKLRRILLPTLVLTFLCLLFTYGRAAWIGVFISFLFIFALSFRSVLRDKKRALVFCVIVLLCLVALSIPGRYGGYTLVRRVISIVQYESALARFQMWRQTLPLVMDRPILGSGPDTYKLVFPRYKPVDWVTVFHQPLLDKAHNELLQMAATTGFLGLLSYLWLLVVFLWVGVRRIWGAENGYSKTLLAGILAGAVAYLVQIQFNFSQFSSAPIFWLMVGLAVVTEGFGKPADGISLNLGGLSERTRLIILGFLAVLCIFLIAGCSRLLLADIHFNEALVHQREGNLDLAIEKNRSAAALNPWEELYWLSLGKAYARKSFSYEDALYGKLFFESAETTLKKAQALNPLGESVHFAIGDVYFEGGKRFGDTLFFEEAAGAFREGLKLNPTSAEGHFRLGLVYAHLAHYEQAVSEWNEVIALGLADANTYFNLGWVYERQNESQRAKEVYEKALELDPELLDAKKALKRLGEKDD